MKTHEELVQTARVLHKALKVDLTIYGGDRDCIVKFTKKPISRGIVWKTLGSSGENVETSWESEGR